MTFSIGACRACDARAPLFGGRCIRCAVVWAYYRRALSRALLERFGEPVLPGDVAEHLSLN